MSDNRLILPNALQAQIQQAMWLVGRHPAFAVAWGGNPGVHENYRVEWPNESTLKIFREQSYDQPCMIFANINFTGIKRARPSASMQRLINCWHLSRASGLGGRNTMPTP